VCVVVAMRERGVVGAATPVTAGSHSSRCRCEVAVLCCDVCRGVDEGSRACFVVEGCATPINLAGSSWGALGCWAEGVCLVRDASGCATTLSTVSFTPAGARTKPGRWYEALQALVGWCRLGLALGRDCGGRRRRCRRRWSSSY
jgi:hypothetical protein